jgi:hypothetical protein
LLRGAKWMEHFMLWRGWAFSWQKVKNKRSWFKVCIMILLSTTLSYYIYTAQKW